MCTRFRSDLLFNAAAAKTEGSRICDGCFNMLCFEVTCRQAAVAKQRKDEERERKQREEEQLKQEKEGSIKEQQQASKAWLFSSGGAGAKTGASGAGPAVKTESAAGKRPNATTCDRKQ